jgi:hypothetical protein
MFEIIKLKIKNKLLNYLYSRFGIDKEFFDNYDFFIFGKKVFILSKQKNINFVNILNLKNLESIGIELFVNYKEYLLSSLAFTIFDYKIITQNYIKLNRKQAQEYFRSKTILFDEINNNNKNILSFGNVIAIYNEKIIGVLRYTKSKEFITNNIVSNLEVK